MTLESYISNNSLEAVYNIKKTLVLVG